MALSRTDRERLTLVAAALEAEAKEAEERASRVPERLYVAEWLRAKQWEEQCLRAANTLRELIARRERSA